MGTEFDKGWNEALTRAIKAVQRAKLYDIASGAQADTNASLRAQIVISRDLEALRR